MGSTLPLEESKLRLFSKMPLRSRNTSLRKETSLRMATLDSVLMSISISESSMTPTLVSSVWISTLSLEELERELPEESTVGANLVSIKESPPRMPSNGSPKKWLEPSFDEMYLPKQTFVY